MKPKNIGFSQKEKLYYKSIDKYYRNLPIEKKNIMINIINGKSNISLRLLDWFVTRYSNEKNIFTNYTDKYTKKNKKYYVYIGYKSHLKSYKKTYFDPFRRRLKFIYTYDRDNNKQMETTLGQLNFFKWIFDFKILDYVNDNLLTLQKEMMKSNKLDKIKKNIKIQKKKESSKSNDSSNNSNSSISSNITNDTKSEKNTINTLSVSFD